MASERELLCITADDVRRILDHRELELIDTVKRAYLLHARGASALPHSVFLRFPDDGRNRIIALPAFLAGDFELAGLKWIASFPGNHGVGLDRASGVILLNSPSTGRPFALLEGSAISAARTAASAALAACFLVNRPDVARASFIGCGVINFEILRFLRAVWPALRTLRLFDHRSARAERFAARALDRFPDLAIELCTDRTAALGSTPLISIATTSAEPHVGDLGACDPDAVILHVSLRDIAAAAILDADNIVDDVEHVCRERTSIHLAEERAGHRDFIRGTLAQVLEGSIRPRAPQARTTIFSPFGLGILDIAVAKTVYECARDSGLGSLLPDFLPLSTLQ